MSGDGLSGIEHTVQLTHSWINALDYALGWDNKPRSYRLLRCVLQALRDWLPAGEMAQFAAQLPTLLRGVYYEHWRPSATPVSARAKDDFLQRIEDAFTSDPIEDNEVAAAAVFGLLNDRVGGGEVAQVREALPTDLRAIWPAAQPPE